ncbi:MAG: hypothetical protein K2P30_16095 [Lachnospiraceae bacterium]|nr:hypothetical protein [Lachnospiraceae bacterium]MDE6965137.1 hypothetical protein [Lachnospiraceae bacterium]
MPRVDEAALDDVKLDAQSLKEEKKKLKKEKKEQRKAAKEKARELASQEEELMDGEGSGNGSVFLVTFIIVLIWIAILCLVIKLDFGGFGSNVLAPILKDVPVINMILPKDSTGMVTENGEDEAYAGYDSIQDAVDYIKELELELERAQSAQSTSAEEISRLEAEVERLQTFEDGQVEFQRIKTEFYEEVVYAEKGPGLEEYRKYYEEMDPATAEYLYKQVITQLQESDEITKYASAYSSMKPKAAAAIFENMTDNLDLAVRILGVMSAEDRAKILAVMDTEIAAKITKLMDPES